MAKRKKKKNNYLLVVLVVLLIIIFQNIVLKNTYSINNDEELIISYNLDDIPETSQAGYVVINDNIPSFNEKDMVKESFEKYGPLDDLGRCTYAYANISKDIMPTEKRGSIGSIKPTGWQISKYEYIDGKYLYNRCHLIGYQLTGENANKNNLITCTRQMNTGVMLNYENKVANYIKETNNHVLYRVTPIFENDNLLAKGVIMEALSVEDNGEGIKFNIFVYNIQDGVIIDYSNGDNYPE